MAEAAPLHEDDRSKSSTTKFYGAGKPKKQNVAASVCRVLVRLNENF